MPELKERFSRKEWKDCCGKGCKDCDIVRAYSKEHGKKEGLARLNDDRAAVKAGKKAKSSGKAGTKGKKAKHAKKAAGKK